MDEIVKQIYEHRVSSFERQIKVVENRLQFVNWLFGVSSASLFSAFAIIRTNDQIVSSVFLNSELTALAAGFVSFLGVLFTYFAKKEGNRSIESVIKQLTYLDVQAAALLDPNMPKESVHDRVLRFVDDDYLEPRTKEEMKALDKLYDRKRGELYWQGWLLKSVIFSLLFILVSMGQSVFASLFSSPLVDINT